MQAGVYKFASDANEYMIAISGYALQEKMRHNHNIDTYYALRSKDKRKVLLKVPNNHHGSSENLAILQHEFHVLQKINIPTIIKAYDFLQSTASPVLVLEGVEGQLLSTYLDNKVLSISDFFNLALQLVDILGELHQLHIIHKEIRPSNIIIDTQTNTLKLIDLSASTKLYEETSDYLNFNRSEESLIYISPEQTGRMNRPLDYRTDFYSLGITLYQMLTNQLPFKTSDPLELVHCHIAKKPPNILKARADTPKMLAAIIEKLLQKMPEERYLSIVGLKADLIECHKQWLTKKNNANFKLGMKDTREHLSISRTLYGREQEVSLLLNVFERISKGKKEFVLLGGYSGIGKTSLVKEVHKPIVKHHGYYIQGKFDQLRQSTPYSAIVVAFQNLIKQVLAQNETRVDELKAQLIKALGNIGQVVIDVIPEVELIIGPQPPVPNLNPSEAQIRFNLVFQNFVRVFAKASHPLVLFLDDLQWADNSSLSFIENLLQDQDTNYLLLIGAYRDNEINETHPLTLTLNNLHKPQINLTTLKLQPLSLRNVQRLLQDTLSGSAEKIRDLSKCIYNKTQGNPFFINEFIKILHQDNLLFFSYEEGAWRWDLAKIQQQSATDNVIDLLTAKIHHLPPETQETLKLASCLGHEFNFKTLLTVGKQTVGKTAESLCQAIKVNLIYPLQENYKTLGLIGLQEFGTDFNFSGLHYRFAHDRIQQASYSLIVEHDRASIHLKIGNLLLQEKKLAEQDERLFDITKHLNHSINLLSSEEKRGLATYNLWAGQRAKSSSAYYMANDYLTAGVSLLSDQSWQTDYDLMFQLYKELAVCRYLIGDFSAADHYFSTLLMYGKSSLDNLEIYRLKIEMYSTLSKHHDAINLGLEALRDFGIKIPRKPNLFHILSAIYKVKFQVKNKEIENIDLPPMIDKEKRAIVNLITQLLNSAFVTDQHLLVVLICKNIGLSLKFGYTESTSMCIPVFAFVLMHSLNLYNQALDFVKLYNNLKKKYGASNFEGKNQFVLGSFIEPYQILVSDSNTTLNKAFRLCCEVGDLVYSNYSNLTIMLNSFTFAKSLEEIRKNLQFTSAFISRVNISDFQTVVNFWDYALQCLQSDELSDLNQSLLYEKLILTGQNKTECCFFYSTLTRFHYLLGNFAEAVKMGHCHEEYSEFDKPIICHLDGRFFYALSLAASYSQLTKSEQKTTLKKLKKMTVFVNKYAKWCPTNYKAYSLLLNAEVHHVKQQYDQAFTLYEKSLEEANSSGLIFIAALVSERIGHHCMVRGLNRLATLYLHGAMRYYKEWGAHSKLNLLQKQYPNFNLNIEKSKQELSTTAGQNLDMLAIFKFTQLISSEIRLDKLLQKFMTIVLENAGAQRSLILAQINDDWVIEAEGDLEQQTVYLNGITNNIGQRKFPLSVLNYVQRTQKPIIINDTNQSELIFNDPYIQKENPRSLLMMPLFYQNQLCRILYLESKSSSYTFTVNHLDSLKLLSSQAMTSLENAKLYYQATHDPLTGLANRNLLYEVFKQTAKPLTGTSDKIALLFIDLDYFKLINDTLGHAHGDKLLIHIAQILSSVLRDNDLAARIGGDEFIVMLTNIHTRDQIISVAEYLAKELSKPLQIGDHLLQITISMGISIFPTDGSDIQTLLKLADTALYQAKERGRNQFHFYSTELYQEYQWVHSLESELQRAYDKQELFLMYQPLHDIQQGKLAGLETLLRWNHPTKGLLEASDFMMNLEKSPLIIPITERIIRMVCKQAQIWKEEKLFDGSIAINISAAHFKHHSLSELMRNIFAEHPLCQDTIEFEIMETRFIEYNENLYREIEELEHLGVNLVIDDFGTGYSSLSYLKTLPIKKIKIDKVFIKNCDVNFLDQTIITAIVNMAHTLNIKIIAEGVENEAQLQFLKDQQVDIIQGYYYSRALTVEGCEIYLKKLARHPTKI